MERVIRVRDLKELEGGFRVFLDLPDLLLSLDPEGYGWTWAIQRVPELTAYEGWDFNLPALERQIEADHRGLQMTFQELQRFGDRVQQVIWGEFLAAESPNALPRSGDDAAMVGRKAVAGLAAIDSSYWLVGGPAHVVDRVAARFATVDDLSPDNWDRAED
jgi:hypothetical protein